MSDTATNEKVPRQVGDRVFAGTALAAGLVILLALAGVFVFLALEGWPGLSAPEAIYRPATNFWSYVGPLVFGTTLAAVIALVIAVPFAIAIALFISHYAPRRLATPISYVMDLLAAVPSVVYGLWGGGVLSLASSQTKVGWTPTWASCPSSRGRRQPRARPS